MKPCLMKTIYIGSHRQTDLTGHELTVLTNRLGGTRTHSSDKQTWRDTNSQFCSCSSRCPLLWARTTYPASFVSHALSSSGTPPLVPHPAAESEDLLCRTASVMASLVSCAPLALTPTNRTSLRNKSDNIISFSTAFKWLALYLQPHTHLLISFPGPQHTYNQLIFWTNLKASLNKATSRR